MSTREELGVECDELIAQLFGAMDELDGAWMELHQTGTILPGTPAMCRAGSLICTILNVRLALLDLRRRADALEATESNGGQG